MNPGDIRKALDWAVKTSEAERIPVVVEVITERTTNAAMGATLDNIKEFGDVINLPAKGKQEVA